MKFNSGYFGRIKYWIIHLRGCHIAVFPRAEHFLGMQMSRKPNYFSVGITTPTNN